VRIRLDKQIKDSVERRAADTPAFGYGRKESSIDAAGGKRRVKEEKAGRSCSPMLRRRVATASC